MVELNGTVARREVDRSRGHQSLWVRSPFYLARVGRCFASLCSAREKNIFRTPHGGTNRSDTHAIINSAKVAWHYRQDKSRRDPFR